MPGGARVHLGAGGWARRHLVPRLAKPAVIDLVAEAVETAAAQGRTAEHPWAHGIAALEDGGHPAVPLLLRARAEEGSGRSDQARQLIGSCLRLDPDLLPAIRDAMEYELCAGNWARAWELASARRLVRHPDPADTRLPQPGQSRQHLIERAQPRRNHSKAAPTTDYLKQAPRLVRKMMVR
jgi:hypothetical protein